MRRVSIYSVTPGMRLAKGLQGVRGELLLAAGSDITPQHLRLLRERGCQSIDVLDGLTDDIVIPEAISEEVRNKGLVAIQNLHGLLQKAPVTAGTDNPEDCLQALNTREFAGATRDARPVYALADAAMAMVDEILDTGAVLGLGSLRQYDEYTFQHSVGTAVAGVIIGRELGWQREALCDLAKGCLLHDVGKVFIDHEVINKPGALTEEEMAAVRQHAELGYRMVRQLFGPGVISNHVPYQHHERQDGKGYPRKLRGQNTLVDPNGRVAPNEILPLAQVASIADVYDALNSDRSYRPAVPLDRLIELLGEMSSTALNAAVLDRFLGILAPYPVGAEVVLHGASQVEGCSGMVVNVDRKHLRRPTVRVLRDGLGRQVIPFEIDLNSTPEINLETALVLPREDAAVPVAADGGAAAAVQSMARYELARPLLC